VEAHCESDPDTWVEHSYIWEPVVRHVKTGKKGEFTIYPLDPDKLVFTVSWKGLSCEKRVKVLPARRTVDSSCKPRRQTPESHRPASLAAGMEPTKQRTRMEKPCSGALRPPPCGGTPGRGIVSISEYQRTADNSRASGHEGRLAPAHASSPGLEIDHGRNNSR